MAKKKEEKKPNDYKLKKERQSQLRKMKTRLAKCEQEIEKTESIIDEINEKLSSSEYEELMALTSQLEAENKKRDELYEEWERLSLDLTEAEL